MNKSSKTISLLILTLLASNILTIEFANSQTIPKPSIPKFTIKYVDASYDVQTTTSINPYTGKSITNQGYHVDNKTIQLTIDNRPYSSYVQSDAQRLYYNVREKGSFIQNWTNIYTANTGFIRTSNSDYTTVSYRLIDFPFSSELSNGGQVDFQVEAMFGGIYRIDSHFSSGDEFRGVTSEWSGTQTVIVPAVNISLNPSPTVPELSWLVIVPLFVSILLVAVLLTIKRKRHS